MVAREPLAERSVDVRSLDVLARRQLEEGGPWRVHSVFARACNLVDETGALLGIVSASAGNAPSTLVLGPGQPGQPFTALLAPGDPAHRADGLLHVGHQRLDLTEAELWAPEPIRRTLPEPEIARRLAQTVEIAARAAVAGGLAALLPEALALASGQPDSGIVRPQADLVVGRARELIGSLASAIRERRWSDVHAPARALSGLGPGLTPAGDDLLAGLALGLRAGSGTLPEPLAVAIASAVEGRTTDLAAARVRHAVAGRPDERVHQLLMVLVSATDPRLDEAVTALLEFGHSSGADTLVGLLVGVNLGDGSWVIGHG